MSWEFDRDRPIYAQLVEQLQRAIVSGAYAPGAKIPSVRELAAEAGVNPNTMQKALTELEQLGLLNTQRTNGRYVTEDTSLIATTRRPAGVGQGDCVSAGNGGTGLHKRGLYSVDGGK